MKARRLFTKHGESRGRRTPEYRAWRQLQSRCSNVLGLDYKNYGGRGIKVCERWKKYENFLEDMGRRPSSKHSIERKNNDGDYEPENCVWATPEKQNSNKRNNVMITFRGVTKHLAAWAREVGVCTATLQTRLHRWSVEEALTTPKLTHRRSVQLG